MNKKIHEIHKKLNTTKITNHTVTTKSGFQTLDTAKWPQLSSSCALLTSQNDVKSMGNIASKPCDDHSRLTICQVPPNHLRLLKHSWISDRLKKEAPVNSGCAVLPTHTVGLLM